MALAGGCNSPDWDLLALSGIPVNLPDLVHDSLGSCPRHA